MQKVQGLLLLNNSTAFPASGILNVGCRYRSLNNSDRKEILMKKRFHITLMVLAVIALCHTLALAQVQRPTNVGTGTLGTTAPTVILGITGTSYGQGSTIYDVNATNGAITNPRVPLYQSSGFKIPFVGFTYIPHSGGDLLYGLTFSNMTYYASNLFNILPNYSFNTLASPHPTMMNGVEWRCGLEGDIAYDKTNGKLYATCSNGGWRLVSIDPATGVVTAFSLISSGGSYSALAVNAAGELYALDTTSRTLVKLDKATGSIQSTIPLTGALPNTSTNGGMGFNDAGVLYAAFGGKLITINTTNGAVNVIGSTANFSGLIVRGGGRIIRKF